MNFLVKLLTLGFAVLLASFFLPGVEVDGIVSAILVGGVLIVLNATLRPILVFFTLPATIMTLGLFLFVINALIILAADLLLSGFEVANFFWALIFSLVLSVITSVFDSLDKK